MRKAKEKAQMPAHTHNQSHCQSAHQRRDSNAENKVKVEMHPDSHSGRVPSVNQEVGTEFQPKAQLYLYSV